MWHLYYASFEMLKMKLIKTSASLFLMRIGIPYVGSLYFALMPAILDFFSVAFPKHHHSFHQFVYSSSLICLCSSLLLPFYPPGTCYFLGAHHSLLIMTIAGAIAIPEVAFLMLLRKLQICIDINRKHNVTSN